MKKFTLVIAVLFFAFASNAQQATKDQPQTVASQPKDINQFVEFTNADYNFGKIPQGKPSEYEVTIKNIGKDSITLERIQVGCGCTTPKYEANTKIGPGKSYKVTLGFNGSANGAFTKFATLIFNDGMQKQVTFKGETYQTPDTSAPANGAVDKMKTGGN